MTEEELTAQIAEALRALDPIQPPDDIGDYLHEAAGLLPVVRRYGDLRAAEALEAAATRTHDAWLDTGLLARAAALRGEPGR